MQQMLNNYRNMFLFRGIAALVFGVFTLVWPKLLARPGALVRHLCHHQRHHGDGGCTAK